MSWPNPHRISRALALALRCGILGGLALGISACGFEPLYGGHGAATETLGQVRIAQISDRAGQQLRNHLLSRMNPRGQPRQPAYILKVNLVESKHKLGVQPDDVATRANLQIEANYVLKAADNGRPVVSGGISSTNSYNILESEFGTLKAEGNARARAVRELSEALTTRLAVFFKAER